MSSGAGFEVFYQSDFKISSTLCNHVFLAEAFQASWLRIGKPSLPRRASFSGHISQRTSLQRSLSVNASRLYICIHVRLDMIEHECQNMLS